jgi:hypothetical protein
VSIDTTIDNVAPPLTGEMVNHTIITTESQDNKKCN